MTTAPKVKRRMIAFSAVLLMQSVAAIFFLGDSMADLIADTWDPHTLFEAFVSLALVCGVALALWHLQRTLMQMRTQERALEAARGKLAQAISGQFDNWGLTPAERDVGFLALKGLDVAEIAGIRGAASGTVRAQLARIYAKAGVSGRAQFAAWFVEDLLADGIE